MTGVCICKLSWSGGSVRKMSKVLRFLRKLAAVTAACGALLAFAPAALAQGCALCYNDASATGQQGIIALRHGILVLAVPPMLIFAALFAILYKRRNAHHDAGQLAFARNSIRDVSEIVLHLD